MGDGVLGLESWGWGQSGVVPPQSEKGVSGFPTLSNFSWVNFLRECSWLRWCGSLSFAVDFFGRNFF